MPLNLFDWHQSSLEACFKRNAGRPTTRQQATPPAAGPQKYLHRQPGLKIVPKRARQIPVQGGDEP